MTINLTHLPQLQPLFKLLSSGRRTKENKVKSTIHGTKGQYYLPLSLQLLRIVLD